MITFSFEGLLANTDDPKVVWFMENIKVGDYDPTRNIVMLLRTQDVVAYKLRFGND